MRTDKLKQPAEFYSSIPVESTICISSKQYLYSKYGSDGKVVCRVATTMVHFFHLNATKPRLGNDFTLESFEIRINTQYDSFKVIKTALEISCNNYEN